MIEPFFFFGFVMINVDVNLNRVDPLVHYDISLSKIFSQPRSVLFCGQKLGTV